MCAHKPESGHHEDELMEAIDGRSLSDMRAILAQKGLTEVPAGTATSSAISKRTHKEMIVNIGEMPTAITINTLNHTYEFRPVSTEEALIESWTEESPRSVLPIVRISQGVRNIIGQDFGIDHHDLV